MAGYAPRIFLTAKERQLLRRWARRRNRHLAFRARIVLLAARGKTNKEIAAQLSSSQHVVGAWRRHFARFGLDGLKERRGGPRRKLTAKKAAEIVASTKRRLERGKRVSLRTLARAVHVSPATVWRVWRANGLSPEVTRP